MKDSFDGLMYKTADEMIFGVARQPVTLRNGIAIGNGRVIPEVNFTLPPMDINQGTETAILKEYHEMASSILKRAEQLHVEELILEVELLPPMTTSPRLGKQIIEAVKGEIISHEDRSGLKAALRATPNDTREFDRPCRMRTGSHMDNVLGSMEEAAASGADMLSIESTGGKELSDKALLSADLNGAVFALSVLGYRDMRYLWKRIVEISDRFGTIPAGDTACAFGNTAMVLAEQGYIPRLLAAIVRVATVVRSLAAYEEGAIGPGKDCGYENVYIKAIAGVPISMEGRTAACAHLSPVGNVAGAVCDLWSNESVQNIRLLAGMAPVVSLEQLAYDCRLYEAAKRTQHARLLRDWLVESDSHLDPQAFVLRPDSALEIAGALVKGDTPVQRTLIAMSTALRLLKTAYEEGQLLLEERERTWFDLIGHSLDSLSDNPDELRENVEAHYGEGLFIASEYGL